mmetsp:Transcript_81489/g.174580  ORF Transcript_81489/g.174580 Transcript_81489/m.174580 type:complete len:97 (-) Transcript_81489:1459-1749(-)
MSTSLLHTQCLPPIDESRWLEVWCPRCATVDLFTMAWATEDESCDNARAPLPVQKVAFQAGQTLSFMQYSSRMHSSRLELVMDVDAICSQCRWASS